jgi:hypothetical protein
MKKMTSPAIRDLLRNDALEFGRFANFVGNAARRAGLETGARQGELMQINGKWMNLEAFFYRRNITNAVSRMISWFEDLIAGRNPRDRRGNFMDD